MMTKKKLTWFLFTGITYTEDTIMWKMLHKYYAWSEVAWLNTDTTAWCDEQNENIMGNRWALMFWQKMVEIVRCL